VSDIPIALLLGLLVLLVVLSAFFSGSETGMMALNRYRLRHLSRQGHRGAKRTSALLERPDRLIGVILLGNNFVNILASSIATVIALALVGEGGIALGAALLTLVILIFAEVAPKTLAALHPERIAFPASLVLTPLLKLLYPLVWTVNALANGFLRLFGVTTADAAGHALSQEELRTVVNEAGGLIPRRHRQMLLGVLDLEKVSVDDIMVPRNEIVGIDLEDDWDTIERQLTGTEYTRLPVFAGDVEHIRGFVHARDIMRLVMHGELTREGFDEVIEQPYFVPEGTALNVQLLNFQRQKRRMGLVVDEYGDIMGLVTLEDLLEEIVGEFTTDMGGDVVRDVYAEGDGSYLVDGSANVRELNRTMHWELPTHGPKTVNGLVLEHMESIPEVGTCFLIAGYPLEVVQTTGNAVKTVRIIPALRRPAS
jgi:Mg2+/Co2+ transporter CorB